MRISFRLMFIIVTVFILYENIFSTTLVTDSTVVSELLKQSSIYISNSDFDSAGICIENARNAGMSRDSLYYLFSELFIHKSIFDTALAFNYAIIASKNDSMYSKKFEQRYLIYSMLNLKSEADKTMDSLGLYTVKRNFNLYMPRFSVGVNSGYKNNRTYTPELDPGDNQLKMEFLRIKGYSGNLFGSVVWDLPWPGDRLFTVGAAYTSNKSSDQKAFKTDSLAHTWSTSIRLNNYHSLNLSYNFSRNKSRLGTYSSSDALQLSWIKPDSNYNTILGMSLAGNLSIANSKILNQQYMFYCFYEKSLSKRASLVYKLFVFSLVKDKDILTTNAKISNFIGNVGDPFFLTIGYDTIKKPNPLSPKEKNAYKDSIKVNKADTTLVLQQIPYTTISISPSIDNILQLLLGIKLNTSIEWTFTYYNDNYIWKVPHDLTYIARDIVDGKIYNVKDSSNISGGLESYAVYDIKKRRIDNTLAVIIFVEHTVWKLGNLSLGGSVEKTFSTLSNNSPVEIPDWSWDISSSLTINFPFRK